MSITRGDFLRSLGKSLPGLVASTGVVSAAEAVFRRIAHAVPEEPVAKPLPRKEAADEAFLTRGRVDGTAIGLTFDDGPVPGVTERILDVLARHELTATFFMIGERVAAAPDLARRILAEGHELGHHTYTHRKLSELSDTAVEEELDQTNALFQEVLGLHAKWFRPPYGVLRPDQARRVRERGMKVVLFSLDSEDWRDTSAASVSERILTHLHPGAIVLCHDVAATADGLDATLQQLQSATRFTPITIGEMVRDVSRF